MSSIKQVPAQGYILPSYRQADTCRFFSILKKYNAVELKLTVARFVLQSVSER
ncbi:hypothetical protein H206_01494 [Candidatus Electrothrix aarhusensis]|uniref:Uncharacterized protein n=1 Tax=Candidatus Electrothrix aarhusensis TaxID=1859131 RepID=A0A444IUK7_9BACT|nr:hypothetical protein H206_01494 [Candidatus Electrothrix aarhusensis]